MIKLRIIAWFVLLNFLTVTLFPTLSFALTSGPTSPEFSSFEPIETTDMVNLNTGDFTYSLPLLEVPGPEGGYPMALSYHAGISPEEEASWVGLGWSLNPGAVSRMVNGFPDDMNRSTNWVQDVWVGGETNTYTLTVGYGASYVGAGVGLTYATDTYKGVGFGANFNIGLNFSKYASVGISFGTGPYDQSYAGLGLTVHTAGSGANASLSLGIQVSSEQDGITAVGGIGVGVGLTKGKHGSPQASLLGASISSNSKSNSFSNSIGGIAGSTSNSNAGDVSVSSSGWSWDIFNWYGVYVGIGASHTRYFLDKMDQTPVYGSLYGSNLGGDYWNVSYDCYAIPESLHSYDDKPDESLGGSMPSYDHYMVSGQGIGGTIQPYIYEPGALFRKGSVPFYYGSGFNKFYNRVGFRFVYDFSNSFTRNNTDEVYGDINSYVTNVTAKIGIDGKPYDAQNYEDFNRTTGQLAGSKHVEWFTNQQIINYSNSITNGSVSGNGLNGFIPSLDQRIEYFQNTGLYGQDTPDNIGGFLITNESGVSYHYSIPVYNFNDITKYSSNIQGNYSRTITKSLPYAYNWLLTAITGPDYVDRFPYGQVDPNDWGYWVKMEYGKWTDKYTWRTPNEGGSKDVNSSTLVYSAGKKEVYYLDAIKTRSHTALFVKDKEVRRDGKSVSDPNAGGFNILKDGTGNISALPVASLKLNRILLFNNRTLQKQMALINNGTNALGISSLKELNAKGNLLQHSYLQNGTTNFIIHQGKNILDEDDLNDEVTKFSALAVRQYKFKYTATYPLCQGLPNSFDIDYNADKNNMIRTNQNSGKLTLESIQTVGYKNSASIPPTSFQYALPDTRYDKNALDVWGSYKKDYTTNDYQRSRTTQYATQESAKYKQAWSLNKIHTPLGADINIEYESDYYKTVAFANKKSFVIKSLTYLGGTDYEMELFSTEPFANLNEIKNTNVLPKISLLNQSFDITTANLDLSGRTEIGTIDHGGYYMHKDNNISILPEEGSLVIDNIRNVIKFRSQDLYTRYTNPYYKTGDKNNGVKSIFQWTFYTGNIVFDLNNAVDVPGGDLRVKSIGVYSDLTANITEYQYRGGTTSYLPVDFNPMINLDEFSRDTSSQQTSNGTYLGISTPNIHSYKDNLYKQFYSNLFANTSFIPPPGILYENVIVQDKVRHYNANNDYTEIAGEGSVKYDFTVFDNSMIGRVEGATNTLADHSIQRTVTMKDYRNRVGLLKCITNYDGLNATGNVLSSKKNNYLHEATDYETQLNDRFANQGRIDQVFFEKKTLNAKLNLLITKVEEHPIVQVSTIDKDHKKGTVESRVLAFDFYNGLPTASWSKDAWGNEFISETVPAYQVTDNSGAKVYSGMGLRVNDPTNKNMLTQEGLTTVYTASANKTNPVKLSDYNKIGLVSSSAQTWTTGLSILMQDYQYGVGIIYQDNPINGIVWRKEASYSWIGNDNIALNADGTYDYAQFTKFDFGTGINNGSSWQKNGSVSTVDVFSHLHESMDLNNNSSALLMDPTLQYITATASFAKRNEFAYSGAEFNEYYVSPNSSYTNKILEGNVKLGNGVIVYDSNKAHTGAYSLSVPTNKEGFSYSFTPQEGKKYKASTWLYLPGSAEGEGTEATTNARLIFRVKGTNTILNKPGEGYRSLDRKARSFYLMDLTIDAASIAKVNGLYPEVEVVCINDGADRSIYFDDFRVSPLESDVTSYVYDLDKGLLTHILDNDNFYTRFEYDGLGRLRATYRELFKTVEKKIQEQRINYSNQ